MSDDEVPAGRDAGSRKRGLLLTVGIGVGGVLGVSILAFVAFVPQLRRSLPLPTPPPVVASATPVGSWPSGLWFEQMAWESGLPLPTVLARYPNLEAPREVVEESEFDVTVTLTEEPLSETTEVVQGETTGEGQLVVRVPGGADSWPLDVTLSAPGFEIGDGTPRAMTASLDLPRQGDSTAARFTLRAERTTEAREVRSILATLWHEGTYLARMSRHVLVCRSPCDSGGGGSGPEPLLDTPPGAALVDVSLAQPDLTLILRINPEKPSQVLLTIVSPHLVAASGDFTVPTDLRPWLETQYSSFAQAAPRGAVLVGEQPQTTRDLVVARLRGFGKDLYRRFAPSDFKRAYWQLRDRLGDRFRSIQVLTDDPLLPWELMRPSRDDGSEEGEFLGVQLRLARWHLGPAPQLERPPQVMGVREVAVISPQYQGAQSLPNQGLELDRLKLVFGFRAVPGRLDTVGSLAASPPPGIVHFLGHGIVKTSAQGIPEYSVRLEDADVDITTWRGLTVGPTASHPLFFFNACDLGGAQRVASFVEGWAPAVLDAGASGYVGGLWPLGDRGAAMFARRFYDGLDPAFRGKPVVVSDLLRQARRGFYETGDPTFLAYVFYGDPLLALRATSQP